MARDNKVTSAVKHEYIITVFNLFGDIPNDDTCLSLDICTVGRPKYNPFLGKVCNFMAK
jgi:hypothetical protein